MTWVQLDNFHKADDKRYILRKNKEFLKWYRGLVKNGYRSILDLEEMQKLIDYMVMFFEFKYPNKMISSWYAGDKDNDVLDKCVDIASKLDINQLLYRLEYDYQNFLQCSYSGYLWLRRNEGKDNLWKVSEELVEVLADGTLNKYHLEGLKQAGFIDDIEGIDHIEQLLNRFKELDTNVDYSELEKYVSDHYNNIALRNKILELVPFALLYSHNTLPANGFSRAQSFMRIFRKQYGIKFNSTELANIMVIDYNQKVGFSRILKK